MTGIRGGSVRDRLPLGRLFDELLTTINAVLVSVHPRFGM